MWNLQRTPCIYSTSYRISPTLMVLSTWEPKVTCQSRVTHRKVCEYYVSCISSFIFHNVIPFTLVSPASFILQNFVGFVNILQIFLKTVKYFKHYLFSNMAKIGHKVIMLGGGWICDSFGLEKPSEFLPCIQKTWSSWWSFPLLTKRQKTGYQ